MKVGALIESKLSSDPAFDDYVKSVIVHFINKDNYSLSDFDQASQQVRSKMPTIEYQYRKHAAAGNTAKKIKKEVRYDQQRTDIHEHKDWLKQDDVKVLCDKVCSFLKGQANEYKKRDDYKNDDPIKHVHQEFHDMCIARLKD